MVVLERSTRAWRGAVPGILPVHAFATSLSVRAQPRRCSIMHLGERIRIKTHGMIVIIVVWRCGIAGMVIHISRNGRAVLNSVLWGRARRGLLILVSPAAVGSRSFVLGQHAHGGAFAKIALVVVMARWPGFLRLIRRRCTGKDCPNPLLSGAFVFLVPKIGIILTRTNLVSSRDRWCWEGHFATAFAIEQQWLVLRCHGVHHEGGIQQLLDIGF